jgi:hypothetical protein
VATKFLRPTSVVQPYGGDFDYLPQVFLYEDTTIAGLEAQLSDRATIQAVDPDNYWVVESVEYQVVVTKHALGMDPAEMNYSAMVYATQVIIL